MHKRKDEIIKHVAAVNHPNEDSELTLLMRKMYEDTETVRAKVINDDANISEKYFGQLEQVHTAIASDPGVKTPIFTAFNKALITEAEAVKNNVGDKKVAFNKFVNRCIDCHKSFCPGPISRIKKLKITI